MFLLHNYLHQVDKYRTWVGPTIGFDHFSIFLELDNNEVKLGSPFKYNPIRALEEEVQELVKKSLVHYNLLLESIACE